MVLSESAQIKLRATSAGPTTGKIFRDRYFNYAIWCEVFGCLQSNRPLVHLKAKGRGWHPDLVQYQIF